MIRGMNEGAPADCIQLGLGEPSWSLPASVRNTVSSALSAVFGASVPCAYGPNAGVAELREALRERFSVSDDELLVSAGSQGALFAFFQAWLNPGDAVLIPDPGFLAYPALARLAGAIPVTYPLGENGDLEPLLVEKAMDANPGAKALILNHPANPTGGAASAGAIEAVAALCETRGIFLVSDEVYRELYLTERPASLRDVSGYGVVVSSISKAWGSPGLRVGWAMGNARALAPARTVHNFMTSCAARPSQAAAVALLEASDVVIPAARAELRLRWNAFSETCGRCLGFTPDPPAGAFYYWLKLPGHALADPLGFCMEVRDEGRVIVIPGIAFGENGRSFARVSFAAMPEDIVSGVERLALFWKAHKDAPVRRSA